MKLLKSLLTLAAVAAIGHSVQAAPITGSIDFSGAVEYNTTSLATATQVNHFYDVAGNIDKANVSSTTGAYTVIPLGTDATFVAPYVFTPSTAYAPLWTVTAGGETFTFELTSSTVTMQTASFLDITGVGFLTGTGTTNYDRTPGSWAFSSQSSGGATRSRFSFSANNTALPDAGSALTLLGIGMMGVEAVRRKFNKI